MRVPQSLLPLYRPQTRLELERKVWRFDNIRRVETRRALEFSVAYSTEQTHQSSRKLRDERSLDMM
jgi:hypothetical protein